MQASTATQKLTGPTTAHASTTEKRMSLVRKTTSAQMLTSAGLRRRPTVIMTSRNVCRFTQERIRINSVGLAQIQTIRQSQSTCVTVNSARVAWHSRVVRMRLSADRPPAFGSLTKN